MNLKDLEKLIKLFEKSEVNTLKIEEEGVKIELQKEEEAVPHMVQTPAPPVQVQVPVTQPSPSQSAAAAPAAASQNTGEISVGDDETVITSPMVGTFYASSSPDNPPYVKIGDRIRKGDPVCIIEAMKLFNEIESEIDGMVVKILVNNEETVEFGQALMVIKKG